MRELVSVNPATGEELGRVAVADEEEVRRKVSALRSRLPAPPLPERIALIERAARRIRERSEDLARLLTREQGKPIRESRAEAGNSAERLEYFCARAPEALRPLEERLERVRLVTRFQPIGVVAAVKPWNFPLNIPLWTIGPALLAGNAVLFKPSERVPLMGEEIGSLFEGGLIELVQGGDETGRAVIESDADMVSFVGSQRVGQEIMARSAPKLRRLALELGGKDPLIVCADADLDAAVEGAIAATFRNCGQVCCSAERLFVEEPIYEAFVGAVVARVKSMKIGNGLDEETDIGPLNREEEVARVERHLEDARRKGATVLTGGTRGDGLFFAPTVITDLSADMAIVSEETFGPVMSVTRVKDVEEAVRRANETEFGLTASVWSRDVEKADRIAQRIQAGTVGINQPVGSIAQAPWGGVKRSGIGRLLGPDAVREFTQIVNYRFPQ